MELSSIKKTAGYQIRIKVIASWVTIGEIIWKIRRGPKHIPPDLPIGVNFLVRGRLFAGAPNAKGLFRQNLDRVEYAVPFLFLQKLRLTSSIRFSGEGGNETESMRSSRENRTSKIIHTGTGTHRWKLHTNDFLTDRPIRRVESL